MLVNSCVKVAGYYEIWSCVPFGTAENVSMVNKNSVKATIFAFLKDHMAVVSMVSTDVDEPRQPEARGVGYAAKVRSGQNFQERDPLFT
jgi:hypothetical protein